jgi:hypothetical protein
LEWLGKSHAEPSVDRRFGDGNDDFRLIGLISITVNRLYQQQAFELAHLVFVIMFRDLIARQRKVNLNRILGRVQTMFRLGLRTTIASPSVGCDQRHYRDE